MFHGIISLKNDVKDELKASNITTVKAVETDPPQKKITCLDKHGDERLYLIFPFFHMVWVLVFNATLYFSYIVAVIFCIFRFDTFYFKKRTLSKF
jgi:hypothetical protein